MMHGTLTRDATKEGGDLFFAQPGFAADGGRFVEGVALPHGSFADRKGPNWLAIAAIVGAHFALLFALVKLDVIRIEKPQPHNLTVFDLSEPAPPALVKPEPQKAVEKVEPQIVTPAPIVQTIAPPPVAQAQVTNTPPPPPKALVVATAPVVLSTGPQVLDHLDEPISRPPFIAPKVGRKDRGLHTVQVQLIIGTDGTVEQSSVAQSSGIDVLDQFVVRWVKHWRFRPVTRNGAAIQVRSQVPVSITVN